MNDAERTSLLSESLDYLTPRSGGSSLNGQINELSPLTRDIFNNSQIPAASRGDNSSNTTNSAEDKFRQTASHLLSETSSRRGYDYPLPPGTFYSTSTQGQMRTFAAFNIQSPSSPPRLNVSGDPSTNDGLDLRNQNLFDFNGMPAFFNPSRLVPFEPAFIAHDSGSIDPFNKFAVSFFFVFNVIYSSSLSGIEENYLQVKNINMILVALNLRQQVGRQLCWQVLRW